MPRYKKGNSLLRGFILALITIFLICFTRPTTDRVIAQTPEQNQADILFEKGIEEYQADRFGASLESWQEALTIYQNTFHELEKSNSSPKKKEKENELLRKQGKVLSNIATAYYSLEQYQKALDYYQKRVHISRRLKDGYGEAKSLNGMGKIYYILKKYPQAIGFYKRSLAMAKEMQLPQGEGITLNNLGDVYLALSNHKQGVASYEESLAIARKIGDRYLESQSLENLGKAHKNQGEYQKAVEYFESSLNLAKEIGNRSQERAILNNLGIVYYRLGQFNKALEYHQQSRTRAAALGMKKEEASALNLIGSCYYALGDYNTAKSYYQQSLAIAEKINAKKEQAKALNNLGSNYSTIGEPKEAILQYQQSLKIAKEINDRQQQARVLGNLGVAYSALGEYQKGIDSYRKQLILIRKIGSKAKEQQVSIDLGKTHLALKDYVGVIDTYEQIINFSNLPNASQQAIVLGTLGNAYLALGNNQRAIEYLKPYLEITEKIEDIHGQKIALNHLGLALYNTGNLVEAEKLLRKRIALGENTQESAKFSEFELQALPYNTLQKTLIAENKPQEALLVAERARERDLADLLGEKNLIDRAKKLSLEDIKKIAKDADSTLVVYSLPSRSQLYIWVIKSTGTITFSGIEISNYSIDKNDSSLSALIDRYLTEIAVNNSEAEEKKENKTNSVQKEIYKILIEPIADLLPKNPEEEVIFVLQKELFSIPFSLLKDPKGKYLIERHTLGQIPTIELLKTIDRNSKKEKKVSQSLVIGNGKQTEAIAKLLKAKKLTKSKDNETEIKKIMPQAKVIYFATNKLLNNSVTSGISLAASENDDGWLTSQEILKLDLKAQLVIINVNNLTTSQIKNNNIISLSGALINAGVERVVFSLKSIPDNDSKELISEFYTRWQKNGRVAQSLRQAMLKEIKAEPKLQNWAAFSLIGR